MLIDVFGRTINYLRLSVTDRCNMRCSYCMPAQGVVKKCHEDVLSYEELLLIAKSAVGLGVQKIRITGGEPLVRAGIVNFLSRLAAIEGLRHLVVSTNGLLLSAMATELYLAGVQRLNVSLDSLNKDTFAAITRGGELNAVLTGLDAVEKAGFPPPKLNMVVMRGVNDSELLDFVDLTRVRGCSVRFIEYMPVIKEGDWQRYYISGDEIIQRIAAHHVLEPIYQGSFAGPSRDFIIKGTSRTIGIITAVSNHFCGECNRIRVTSTGQGKGCLFSDDQINMLPFLRPPNPVSLTHCLKRIAIGKPNRHSISCSGYEHQNFTMAQIGG